MNREEKELIMKSVVSSFCVNRRMFTSVEIANHLKRLGVWIRNRYVGEYLRDNVYNIGNSYGIQYGQSTIHVDGQHKAAICHHPTDMDANNYMSRDLEAITSSEFEMRHGMSPFEKEDEIPPMLTRGETLVKKPDIVKAEFKFVVD